MLLAGLFSLNAMAVEIVGEVEATVEKAECTTGDGTLTVM